MRSCCQHSHNSSLAAARSLLCAGLLAAVAQVGTGTAADGQDGRGVVPYVAGAVPARGAVACDPDEGNGWRNIWGESLRRRVRQIAANSLRLLIDTKFLRRTPLSYNRWLLP